MLLSFIHLFSHILYIHVFLRVFRISQLKYKLHSAPFANHVFFDHIEERCAITLLDQVITAMSIFRPTE